MKNQPRLVLGNFLKLLLLCAAIGSTSCSGHKKLFSGIENQLTTSQDFSGGFSGLAIYDPIAKKFLYEHHSHRYFTPASTIKLFTFYTGLKLLEDSIPGIRYTKRKDSLIFQGTGDPSLLNPTLPESAVFKFLQDEKRHLYYLPSRSSAPPMGSGWAWDDYPYPFSAERSVLPVYGNLATFRFSSLKDTLITPRLFSDSVISGINKSGKVTRELNSNLFHLPGGRKSLDQQIPFKTSEPLSVEILSDTLGRSITILSDTVSVDLPRRIKSVAADSLYKRMLQQSDNLIAEQILIIAAGEHTDTLLPGKAIQIMKNTHLRDLPDPVKWVDGSGLSRYNLVTPRSVIMLLEKIKEEMPYTELFALLSTGGHSGTLKNQFRDTPAFVFGKTGSMGNQYSLSGYLVTEKGKILLFSFMNSNFMAPSASVKDMVEEILKKVRNHF